MLILSSPNPLSQNVMRNTVAGRMQLSAVFTGREGLRIGNIGREKSMAKVSQPMCTTISDISDVTYNIQKFSLRELFHCFFASAVMKFSIPIHRA